MISKSVCHFLIAWHAPCNVGLPHNATMGRDEILQQTPLKSHLIKNKAFLKH
ncbi:hypothetical protein C730_07950 [Helicobacter pylori Rif2]|uniref:hypothetical protein n=1 Tax=Helicobacter pylori TaxID=210 RepID=UPI000291CCED|nr:hypothetical protein [Helicobacter pylori]AFV42756.1 hypothetical protein C694_07945 [Helicobacter pylori 26695]AFV44353.1 hypothetical protein C695_07965 [Helicobacter pylori Rif1]AFV45943.1 hypothetical protein C730_07950 [Helicobacter pylori Rif2]OUC10016.1 hypothetical protein X568_07900 [Helicobacter pylori SS1]